MKRNKMAEFLTIVDIIADKDCQPRERLDEDYIAELRFVDGLPPIDVFSNGESYWIADGFHRYFAAKTSGKTTIEATIHQGTKRDAELFSCGVNATHGKRRTNEDKRRAVLRLLEDEEWRGWSDNEIANQCEVSQPFVSSLRKTLSYNDYKIDEPPRTVKRGDTTYTMNTSNIGRKERHRVVDEAIAKAQARPVFSDLTETEQQAAYARAWAELMGDDNGNVAIGNASNHPSANELKQLYQSLQDTLERLTMLEKELQFDSPIRNFFAPRYRTIALAIVQWADEFEDTNA